MIPHLSPALNGPLLALERSILDQQTKVEHWFRSQWLEQSPPLYASVDLRNSGFKLAPVDTNLFPGGFNNLAPEVTPLAVQAVTVAIEKACPDARSVLLIPENHTRNQYYLENVASLANILKLAGLNVRIGSLNSEVTAPLTLALPGGRELLLEPVERVGNRLRIGSFNPCAVWLNNDLSGGVPALIQNLEQNVLPPLHAGWVTRRKSKHFAAFDGVATEFAALVGIDPWRINPFFRRVSAIDFHTRQGEAELAGAVDDLLTNIRAKYRECGVTQEPYVVIKADAGTYGMGVMMVKDPAEVIGLNRKARNKMSVVKDGLSVTEVILQEGVHTFETVDAAVAEPVVYMIDRFVVGGFYRVHTGRGPDENLNAPGMHFVPLAFEQPCTTPDCAGAPDSATNRFYAYGVVARLALLAAARELADNFVTSGNNELVMAG